MRVTLIALGIIGVLCGGYSLIRYHQSGADCQQPSGYHYEAIYDGQEVSGYLISHGCEPQVFVPNTNQERAFAVTRDESRKDVR